MNEMFVYRLKADSKAYQDLIVSKQRGKTVPEIMRAFEDQFSGHPVPRPWSYPRLRRDPAEARRPMGDLVRSLPGVTLFSERAAEVMRPLIERCGEFLPMDWEEGRLVAFNVCPLVDAIDFGRCKADPKPFTGCWLPEMCPDLAFVDEVIARTPIFKVPQYAGTAFVTEAFKRRWEEAGLEGARFERVWPWPADPLRLW
jgi:hypothetical protein